MDRARTPSSQKRPLGLLSFSLPVLISGLVVAAMAIMGTLLMWQGWQVARKALLESARDSTLAMGQLIDEKVQHLLTPASVTIAQLARDPLIDAPTLRWRLDRLEVLAEVLKRIPYVSASFVGYPNGDFILVRPIRRSAEAPAADAAPGSRQGNALAKAMVLEDAPPGAAYLVQSVTRNAHGQATGQWRFYDDDMRFLGTRILPDYTFDARTRPWYEAAMANGGEQLTQPYVFFTTSEIGVTFSIRSARGGAVVGLDVELSDLAAQLKTLRLTPRSEIAVVGNDGNAYFYHDLSRVYRRENDQVKLVTLAELGVPVLTELAAAHAPDNEATSFSLGGETWFGVSMPLLSFPDRNLRLLVATPDSDLLATIREGLGRQVWWSLGLIAALILVGWFVGHRLGSGIADLTRQAQRLTRFDFRMPERGASVVREIRQLETVLGEVCVTVQNFLSTTETIGREPGLDRMLAKVLQETVTATGCTSGAVYLLDARREEFVLTAVTDATGMRSLPPEAAPTRGPERGAPAVAPQPSPAEAFDAGQFQPQLPLSAVASYPAPAGTGDSDTAMLTVPLRGRTKEPLGLLVLEHPQDASHGGAEFRAFAEKLSGALSSSIERRRLVEAQKKLLDGFVLLIADAIDAKSPYTGGHCRRVPELATMIVDRMARDTEGPYKDFSLNDDQRYEFHLGAWLHDCGKVTSPEHVIDKATKLEAIHNRIHEVRTRFEVLWRDAEMAHMTRLSEGADPEASKAERDTALAQLQDDFAFVATCNIGGEAMTDADVARLNAIAQHRWLRHFDDRLGLSLEEERRMSGVQAPPLPALEPLLADRPEHIAPWFGRRPPVEKGDPANIYGFDMKLPVHQENRGEVYNLSIRRGTLTDEERFKINDHVVQTYMMLTSLPWPAHLSRVPEIAATHHERMDGRGYPRHLSARGISVEERVMALADVFEALTAADRPYKPAKTLTQSLKIMAFMCKEGHLDPEVFRYFLESGLWEEYAARFLRAEQRDPVDLAALLALLPQAEERQESKAVGKDEGTGEIRRPLAS